MDSVGNSRTLVVLLCKAIQESGCVSNQSYLQTVQYLHDVVSSIDVQIERPDQWALFNSLLGFCHKMLKVSFFGKKGSMQATLQENLESISCTLPGFLFLITSYANALRVVHLYSLRLVYLDRWKETVNKRKWEIYLPNLSQGASVEQSTLRTCKCIIEMAMSALNERAFENVVHGFDSTGTEVERCRQIVQHILELLDQKLPLHNFQGIENLNMGQSLDCCYFYYTGSRAYPAWESLKRSQLDAIQASSSTGSQDRRYEDLDQMFQDHCLQTTLNEQIVSYVCFVYPGKIEYGTVILTNNEVNMLIAI